MASAIGDLVVRLNANTRPFDSRMRGATAGLGKFAAAGAIAGGAAALITAGINTIVHASRRAIRSLKEFGSVGLDFNASMRSSLAIMSDASASTQREMTAAAFAAARNTGQAADDMAKSYYFLASAGLDAKQSIAALPQVAKFAAAGQFDMATATDLATDAQSALGLEVANAADNLVNLTRVTDVLTGANTLANASSQQFSEALTTKTGAALRDLGKDIEEGVAVLGAFADQGVKGAEAGTRFSMVLRDLQTKSIKFESEFEKVGIGVFDAAGEMRNMADIIGDLESAFVGLSDKARKSTMLDLGFSDKSVSALMTLIGTSDKIREYERSLREMGGITAEVADKQLGLFEKGWNSLKVSIVAAGASLMKWAGPIIGKAAASFGEMVTAVQNLIETSGGFKKIGGAIGEFVEKGMGNLDKMLGSWEMFAAGVKYAVALVRVNALQAWEQIEFGISKKMLEIGDVWLDFTEAFIGGVKLQKKALGLITPGLSLLIDKVGELYDKLPKDRGSDERWKDLESRHRDRRRALDNEERNLRIGWEERQGRGGGSLTEQGALADQFDRPLPVSTAEEIAAGQKDAVDAFFRNNTKQNEAPKTAAEQQAAIDEFFDKAAIAGEAEKKALGQEDAAVAVKEFEPRKLAGAMEKGSSEAYSTIVNAGRRNEQTAESHLKTANKQTGLLKKIAGKAPTSVVSIPN